jgi:hypothetical protein
MLKFQITKVHVSCSISFVKLGTLEPRKVQDVDQGVTDTN